MTVQAFLDSNIYNYEYFQQDDVCRLCWNINAFTDLYIDQLNSIHETKNTLLDIIIECLDIDMSLELCPTKVCAHCCSQLEKFYLFKIFCQETDKKLREVLKKYCETSVESPEPIKIESVPNEAKLNDINSFQDFDSCAQNDETSDGDIKPIKKVISKKYKPKKTPTYCNICRIDLEVTDKFEEHKSVCHGIENGTFKCFGCDKRFKNRKTRLGHELHYCKGLAEGYKCNLCCRFLPSRRIYEDHMRYHRENLSVDLPEDIFKCKQCYKLFKTKDMLNEHILEHGVKKKNFVCESCGRVFRRQDYLHKHKLTHTGEKQHVCPHCSFRTTQRSSLVVHIRKHTGERPYSCDLCPQRCISSSNLRAHRRRHLGIKQYECMICGKKFGYKMTLAEHICAMHSPVAPQPCPLCPARYTRTRALRRHIRAKHPPTDEVGGTLPGHDPEQQTA